jgi:uncharacterized membrane protein (DUF2068 family)
MQTHVKVLGVLFILLSAIGICVALFFSLIMTAAAGIVSSSADPHDAAIALPFIGLAGTALTAFLLALAVPGLITGVGLLKFKPWARIFGIVLSVLHLIHVPFGTALGVYGLIVLFDKDTERLFTPGASGAQLPASS